VVGAHDPPRGEATAQIETVAPPVAGIFFQRIRRQRRQSTRRPARRTARPPLQCLPTPGRRSDRARRTNNRFCLAKTLVERATNASVVPSGGHRQRRASPRRARRWCRVPPARARAPAAGVSRHGLQTPSVVARPASAVPRNRPRHDTPPARLAAFRRRRKRQPTLRPRDPEALLRCRAARPRCRRGGASDPFRDSGAAVAAAMRAWAAAARPSPAPSSGRRRACPKLRVAGKESPAGEQS
jgi:hypothetical protein